jgi:1-acyl-sn-glycerol-3-phosphate acyltransferase
MLGKTVLWWTFRSICRCIAILGRLLFDLEAQGLEYLPSKGPLILVGRRISRVDFFGGALSCSILEGISGMTGAMVIPNCRAITWIGRSLGFLPAFKGRGMSAVSLLEAYKLLRQGKILLMGEEGEVPWDGRLQPLRSGAAWLALRTRAPIAVGLMVGGYDIWPRWARRPHVRGKLVLKVGKPFYLCEAPCDRVTEEMLQMADRRLTAELEILSDGYMLHHGSQA